MADQEMNYNATAVASRTKHCFSLPALINSYGVANYNAVDPLDASLPRLETFMFATFVINYVLHSVLKRIGATPVVSQILTGMILGTTGLGRQPYYTRVMLSDDNQEVLETISGFGFLLFILQVGAKMDVAVLRRTGKRALYLGVVAVTAPSLSGFATAVMLRSQYGNGNTNILKLFAGLSVHSLTPFPVIWSLVRELKLLNTELGRVGLSSAFVTDLMSLCLVVIGYVSNLTINEGVEEAFKGAALLALCTLILFYVARPAMLWVIEQTPEGWPVKSLHIRIVITGAFLYALSLTFIGLNMFIGIIIAGLVVPPGPPLASDLAEKIDAIASGVLAPLFVATCVSKADFSMLCRDDILLRSYTTTITVALISKFIACLLLSLYWKMATKDALVNALVMISEGCIDIGVITFLFEKKAVTEGMFASSVVAILCTAVISSIFVNKLYDPARKYAGYQKRNMSHSKELRILACIYRPDNITSTINFLEVSCSNTENPAAVDVLHLIKLSGRAAPLFISHKMQKKTASHRSYSQNVILSFNDFHRRNPGIGSMNIFTTLSSPMYMHEDICTLALDSLASFILLPFHKKWLGNGSVESEDVTLRTLNTSVLEKAPCSVGILIDRGNRALTMSRASSPPPSFLVAMIFIGGCDDREAFVLAERISSYPNVIVTVVHLTFSGNVTDAMDWDKILDAEALKHIRHNPTPDARLRYRAEKVNNGMDTLQIIKSIAKTHDLLIVGRRKDVATPETYGLDELDEYPELGCLGNLLASMDAYEKYSALVVQQQKFS